MSWLWDDNFPSSTKMSEELTLDINITAKHSVGQAWLDGASHLPMTREDTNQKRSPATPNVWNSSQCLDLQGLPELTDGLDPGGFLVFSEGRREDCFPTTQVEHESMLPSKLDA